MQADFTFIRRGSDPLMALVATMGYSRAAFVRFSQKEDESALAEALRAAFDYFGGVPGSCPIPWCSSDVVVVLFGRAGRLCQAAMTGNLTKGSSLIGAMVSRET
jgi:hypothetical protein